MLTLAAMAVCTPYPAILFGIGVEPALASLSFLVFVLSLPFTTSLILDYWSRPSLGERLAAGARTLGVAGVVLAITAHQWGPGGDGGLIWRGLQEFNYSRMWLEYAIMASLILVVDLAVGAIQLAITRPAGAGPDG